jgi:membrane-bound metal-dependent hydrolase YbcI (DUF457 family)
VVGTPLGLAAGLATCTAATLWLKHSRSSAGAQLLREATLVPSAVGGLLGGLSHAFLDGIMHADARPFRPFDDANPLLGILPLPALHLVLVAAGGAGFALIAVAADRRS